MSMVDKEKLARLAQALDDRADSKVAKEAERAAQAEAELQAHSEATRDMLGGKSLKYLTQTEYDVLSEEEKQDENVIYYITDLEDRTHDHYNKDVLDFIDDEFVKNLGKGQLLECAIPVEAGWYRVAQTGDISVGAQAMLINVHETGGANYSNFLLYAGVANSAEPVLQQMAMLAFSAYRNNKVRIVYEKKDLYIKGYLELYMKANPNSIESNLKLQILGESNWELIEAVKTESVDEVVYTIKEMDLVPGKIVGEFNGIIEEAHRLAEPVQFIIGDVHKEFDGSSDIVFSLNELGVAPRESEILTTENKIVVDAINELDADLGIIEAALGGYKIWVGTTEELNAIQERDPMTLYFEISNTTTFTEINGEEGNEGIALTPIYDESIPAYSPEEEEEKDIILTSPAGFKFKLVVDDFGNLSTNPVE